MNANRAKTLNLVKDLSEFKPGQWVRAYWGNGDRDHQYSKLVTESDIKYHTEYPAIGTYYRLATPDEIKAGQIIAAIDLLEKASDKFRLQEEIDKDFIKQAIKTLNQVL